jgi:hypothetical protein
MASCRRFAGGGTREWTGPDRTIGAFLLLKTHAKIENTINDRDQSHHNKILQLVGKEMSNLIKKD